MVGEDGIAHIDIVDKHIQVSVLFLKNYKNCLGRSVEVPVKKKLLLEKNF